jgi:hypothetical protein
VIREASDRFRSFRRAWRDFMNRYGTGLVATLIAGRDRWILWLPMAMGCEVAFYFALPIEPPAWPGAVGVAGFVLLAILARRKLAPLLAALLLAALCPAFSRQLCARRGSRGRI